MMSVTEHLTPSGLQREKDRRVTHTQMRRLFFLVLPICIVQVALARIAGLMTGRTNASGQSVLAEARSAADAAIGYAYNV